MKTKRNGATGIAVRNLFTVMVALLLVFGFNACSNGGGGGGPAGGPGGPHSGTGGMDTDGDGFPDAWEEKYGYDPNDPTDPDPNGDDDNDGLTNKQEYEKGTDPKNADSDGDGYKDGWEVANGYNPLDANDPGYTNPATGKDFVVGDTIKDEDGTVRGVIFYYSPAGFTLYEDENDTVGVKAHYLEVNANHVEARYAWVSPAGVNPQGGNVTISIDGTGTAIGTGKKNTALILAKDPNAPAAKSCADYGAGWFLPSKDELKLMFDAKVLNNLGSSTYWSSSQFDIGNGMTYYYSAGFGDTPSNNNDKRGSYYVRAIRAF